MGREQKKPLTFRELRDKLATFNKAQLDAPVRWWGDERGGFVRQLDILPEEFVCMDDRDGYEPRSAVEGSDPDIDIDRDAEMPPLPKGTPILAVD